MKRQNIAFTITFSMEVDAERLADMAANSRARDEFDEFDAVAIHLDFATPNPELGAWHGRVWRREIAWQVLGEPWNDDPKEPF